MSLKERLGRQSAGFWFCLVLGVGLLVSLPALTAGFYGDDYLHLAKLSSPASGSVSASLPARLMSLFTFASGGADTRGLIADGAAPWWTSPDLRIRFFRPLAAALMLADHALFGLHPLGYHVHSVLWWLLWLGGTGLLFRRLLPGCLGLLAFALFAVDDAHWLTIGWIAARNAPVALAFVVWGLLAYLRFRDDAWRPGAGLAFVAWALALLASEMAVSGLMYVVAYEATRAQRRGGDRWWARLRALWPVGFLLVGYAAAYRLTGSGVRGSGAYLNPLTDGAAFVAAAAMRVPAEVGALLLGAPLDLWLLTSAQVILVAVGLAAIALVVPWFLFATRALPPSERHTARWLALGAALSLLPTSAGLLGERSLAAATIGAAATVAMLLRDGWRRWRGTHGRRRWVAAVGVLLLAIPNLVVAAPALVGKLFFMRANGDALAHLAATADAAAPAPARTVLLWSDDPLIASYTAVMARTARPGALPSFRVLAMAPVDLLLTRVAPDELELSCAAGTLLTSEWERLFRAPGESLPAGTTLPLNGLTVRVVEDIAGRPSRVRFRFDAPLDDPSWRFVEWRGRRVVPAQLPSVGETRPIFRSLPLLVAPSEASP